MGWPEVVIRRAVEVCRHNEGSPIGWSDFLEYIKIEERIHEANESTKLPPAKKEPRATLAQVQAASAKLGKALDSKFDIKTEIPFKHRRARSTKEVLEMENAERELAEHHQKLKEEPDDDPYAF